MITGYPNDNDIVEFVKNGTLYLQKPFSVKQLADAIIGI